MVGELFDEFIDFIRLAHIILEVPHKKSIKRLKRLIAVIYNNNDLDRLLIKVMQRRRCNLIIIDRLKQMDRQDKINQIATTLRSDDCGKDFYRLTNCIIKVKQTIVYGLRRKIHAEKYSKKFGKDIDVPFLC